ncbi:hypothetical protein [Belliella alkalica]|uniref:hypothetical protein n=1 Tax=Belliella alkalica TaxID=1730871 RepID=UPI001F4BD97B|nr:hypothetical protein [Belliella alkalica]
MKSAANNFNYEIGYKMNRYEDGTFGYEYVQGLPNSGSLDGLTVNSPIDGLIHSHNLGTDMLSIFSLSDIFALGAMVQENLINNIENFVFGVVTSEGTYLLSISDPITFSNLSSGLEILRSIYINYVKPDNSALQNEIGLLQFLNTSNLGLSLYKGNLSNFNSWDRVRKNNQGTNIVNLNCN